MYDKSTRNPLLNIVEKKLWLVSKNSNQTLDKIYKQQQFFKKEYGIDTTLYVTHFIKWEHPIKNKFFTSPLIYTPITITKSQKIDLLYSYNIENCEYQLNPILKDDFNKLFNIQLDLTDQKIEIFLTNLKLNLEKNGGEILNVNVFDALDNWEIISTNAVGNFNYKKSVLSIDYNQIIASPNQSIKAVLNHEVVESNTAKQLNLNQSDISQKAAIEYAIANNLVIQGPPGTGKSHTIVELIKQYLLVGKKVLFVSEKQSALEVVYKKLKKDKLNWLVGNFNSSKIPKKAFYKNLKETLLKLDNYSLSTTESKPTDTSKEDLFFKTYTHNINIPLTDNQPTILELQTYLAKHQVKHLAFNSKTKIPSYHIWQTKVDTLKSIEQTIITNFEIDYLANFSLIHLNKSIFLEDHVAEKVNKRIDEVTTHINQIESLTKQFDLNWDWKSIEKHCIAASILNLANKSQLSILDHNSKDHKSFQIWSKKYEITKNKLELSTQLVANWTVLPALKSIDSYIDELQNKRSKFKLFKTKTDKLFKLYKETLVSNQAKIEALKQVKAHYVLQNNFTELTLKLKHNLNIHSPETEIKQLNNLKLKLDNLTSNEYMYLLEHANSLDLINVLHQLQPKIQQINQSLRFLFVDFYPTSLIEIKNLLTELNKALPKFKRFVNEVKLLVNLPTNVISFIRANENSIENLSGIVAYHNLLDLKRFNSTLNNFDSADILPNYQKLKSGRAKQIKKQLLDIELLIQQKWNTNNELLKSPISKLSLVEKENRKTFKIAKRIIYHESEKQQQHLSVKSLIDSTNETILELTPVWLINPLSISESLPIKANMFDVVIFDEASQIPLEDALPAIYRAKNVVVVGDSKQMPPSQFFASKADSPTLLQQAETAFKSTQLNWHYRSEHPALMAFSNYHFYNNELSYFPETSASAPIEFCKVEGQYIDGVNKIEAKAIALKYQSLLNLGFTDIGIIAFSKSQEKEISTQLNKLDLKENELLELRNLENTQGIEKEIIIISVCYGPNENNDFNMNFGPINQSSGANRLNVLVTRAQKQMLVFSSVTSSDFKLSDNEGVQLFTDFIRYAENSSSTVIDVPDNFIHIETKNIIDNYFKDIIFKKAMNGLAINCFIQFETKKILLIDPCLHKHENNDILTLLNVINSRFKNVKILMTQDYWQDITNYEQQIIRFFS